MHKVYKYELNFNDTQYISLPYGTEILSVGNQFEKLCMWVKFNTDEEMLFEFKIYVIGTGNQIPLPSKNINFIGTVMFGGGKEVYHVFLA